MKSFIKTLFTTLILSGLVLFIVPAVNASENSCINCHKTLTPFLEEQKHFNQIRIQHLERNVVCSLECHEDRVRQLATANYQQWSDSVHALKGIMCDACHGGDPTQPAMEKAHTFKNNTDPESPVYYTNVPKTCGKCHTKELSNFENSKHYQKLESLKLAPTCTTCHAPHTFSVMNPENFRILCGNCHSIDKKVAPYDIPLKAEDLLGKVNKLKFNIKTAQEDIYWAKQNGTDVSQAEAYNDNAIQTLSDLAPMWHEFNLTHFGDQIDTANRNVAKAKDIVKQPIAPEKTTAPKTPGFLGFFGITALMTLSYILRKK